MLWEMTRLRLIREVRVRLLLFVIAALAVVIALWMLVVLNDVELLCLLFHGSHCLNLLYNLQQCELNSGFSFRKC